MAVTPNPVPRLATPPAGFFSTVRSVLGIGSFADWLFKLLCNFSALLVIGLVCLVVLLLFLQAWPAIRTYGWQTVVGSNWAPETAPEPAAKDLYKAFKVLDTRD